LVDHTRQEKIEQAKIKVEKILRFSDPYHIVTPQNSNYGNFSISKASCLYTGFLGAPYVGSQGQLPGRDSSLGSTPIGMLE
jgi:hypothetical protein